ncbi:MAG: hypothetical protein EOO93_13855, partial [Pedobacter sp.]
MKIFSFILYFTLLTAFGCKKKNLENQENTEFTLNKPQVINSATFTVTNITDNRCPINADCITAGKAETFITVKLKGETKDFILCIGGDCNMAGIADQQTFSISNVNYTVKLIEVNPYNNLSKKL